MARYTKQSVTSLAGINSELTKIQTALADTLSRKGDTPNQMEGTFDANSNRIINLPDPVADHEPMTKKFGEGLVEQAEAARDAAALSATSAAQSAQIAQQYPEGQLAGALAAPDSDVLVGGVEAGDLLGKPELSNSGIQKVAQNLLLAPEFELIPSGPFLLLRNKTTLQTIARFADASNSSDANLFSLPLEVRRDSHTVINSAGTLGGSVDQVWRTAGLSDAFYEVFNTTKDSESFQLLFDTKPARSDGTKKDGTGGGGLSPSDDTYSFDAAMSLQGNRPDATLSFPAVSVEVNQKLKLKRRAGGDTYTITPTANSLTIVNDTTAQTVATITQGGITIGGKTEVLDDVARSSGNYFKTISIPAIAAGSGLTFPISAANTISIVDVDLVVINTAGTARRFFKGTFLSDGNTVTPLTPAVDTLASQFTVDVTLVAGVLTFSFDYVSSVGVSRVHGDVKWTSRTI